ncbi:hypothetical protein [Gordonia sp. NPDC003422]
MSSPQNRRRFLPTLALFLVVWVGAGLVIGAIQTMFQDPISEVSEVDWDAVKSGQPQPTTRVGSSDPASYLTSDMTADQAFAEVRRRAPSGGVFNPGTTGLWGVPQEVVTAADALRDRVFPVVSKSGKRWFSPVQVIVKDQDASPQMTPAQKQLLASDTSFPQVMQMPLSPWSGLLPSAKWWAASVAVCPDAASGGGFCRYQVDVRNAWAAAIKPLNSANLPAPTLTQLATFQGACVDPLTSQGTTQTGFSRQSYPACAAAAAWVSEYELP